MKNLQRLYVWGVFIVSALTMAGPAQAAEHGPVRVSSDVQYEFIARWDAERLNRILKSDTPKFADQPVIYTPARNAVKLYRVTYRSVVPERANRPITTTGLVAVPDTAGTSFPMLSYQHGTVYGKEEVPSIPEQSPETQLMIALFAGQGYVVVGADYFGMGKSDEPESYLVKGSHQQATYDMLLASRAVLGHLKLETPRLFLAGWSQGGFVTMALLEKLEGTGVPVQAAATASAPLDLYAALSGVLHFPRPIDADWISTMFILTSFAFEHYYGQPGLARSVINDEYYDIARRAYLREPFDPAEVPMDLRKLLRKEYFDPAFFAESAYGRLMAKTHSYRWLIRTPVRNYYGEKDEAISIGIGRLAMDYQRAMGAGNPNVVAISTGNTTHRGTYVKAAAQWKTWFDQQR